MNPGEKGTERLPEKSLAVTDAQRDILAGYLRRFLPGVPVWAYGSRIKGTARPYSDLDLVAFVPEDKRRAVGELRDAFDESNLPFIVDLHVWDELPRQFHQEIRRAHVVVQQPESL